MNNALKAVGIAALLPLSACVTATPEGQTVSVPESVAAIAAPGQDLSSVQVQSDGCYWWLRSNPVEDTFIPLETSDQRRICARGQGIPIEDYATGGV